MRKTQHLEHQQSALAPLLMSPGPHVQQRIGAVAEARGGMYSSALRISSATFSAGSTSVLQWLTRLYIDDHADDRQMEALPAIIGGRAGGFPGWVNECFAGGRQSRGIERAKITY